MKFDVLLKNCHLVDFKNDIDAMMDIGILGGKVEEVKTEIRSDLTSELFDLQGALVVPGVIDPHMHASAWLGGRAAHKMLALAGVTTAFDLAGPVDTTLALARKYGAGLNICCLNSIRPGYTVEDSDPSASELQRFLQDSLTSGAIGYKLLGGHYPLSPEATRRAIETANDSGAYVAFHAGTLENGSNLKGMEEALALAGKNRMHLAHINSYCRGQFDIPENEAVTALRRLQEYPNVFAESYLSPYNGTSAKCTDGVPESLVTRRCLELASYAPTEDGLRKAIQDGWANFVLERSGINVLVSGQDGVENWLAADKAGTVSFRVNPGSSRYLIAAGRKRDGSFVVNAFSSDGGGIPRNEIVPQGLALVKWGELSLKEFVAKTSFNTAKMLGLSGKGHLGEGADADITVIDELYHDVLMTIVAGKIVMYRGLVVGQGATVLTTEQGCQAVKNAGLSASVISLFGR